jgi:hypothetical protein
MCDDDDECIAGLILQKSPASGTGDVSKPKLTSQAWRVREVVCTQVSVFLHSERWRCRYLFVYIVAGIT